MLAVAESASGPGFIFWGLFATFGLLVVGYAVWMFSVERGERAREQGARGEGASRERARQPVVDSES